MKIRKVRGGTTEKIAVRPEDEYMHPPRADPAWGENYHFNGYDPVNKVGITIEAGVRPALGVRIEIVAVYAERPFLFHGENELMENALVSGSLKMEPVTPLKRWRIQMKDTFSRASEHGEVEFDLTFLSDVPPCGFRTQRGDRYEQPGILKGRIRIDGKTTDFRGKGIRDHSWEVRTISSWGRWYAFMGYCREFPLSIALISVSGMSYFHGWVRTDGYAEVTGVEVNPVFSGDLLKTCGMTVKTAKDTLRMDTTLVSYVDVPIGEQGRVKETLVTLDKGHGILWYGL